MKFQLTCLLVLGAATFVSAAILPNALPSRYTAKELRQGYQEHVILARPRTSHRATIDDEEVQDHVRVRTKFSEFRDLRVIELDSNDSADSAISRLKATGRYDIVEPSYIRHATATPNDPKFADGSLWSLNNTGQAGSIIGVPGDDIKAVQAWDIIHDAPNVVVAVVDSGLNLTNPDLVPNLWTNPSPTIGDVHGANFVGGSGFIVSGNPTDDYGHGTHVGGIIGAAGNNGALTVGVAWRVQLMAVKVLGSDGSGNDADIVGGISYAINHGANIINASFGGSGSSQAQLTAISTAANHGVIFVAAAGNDSADDDVTPTFPADYPVDNVVTVGASNRRDEIGFESNSNFGATLDLFAPGDEIVSLDYLNNSGTIVHSGTSMAAPHVTGALALLKAQFPADTYRQLINRMLRGVDRSARLIGNAQTGGRLNLYRALTTTTNRPFNDDFASRPSFTLPDLAIRSSNVGATAETGEPAHAGITASATLWWEWTAPTNGNVTIDTTGSNYDTVLAVYTGTSVTALTPVASNDNASSSFTSRVTFPAQAGKSYEIAVDGKNGATGLTLVNLATTPANDSFATPVILTGQSTQVTSNNLHCSRELGEPTILGFTGGASLWYQWTAPRTGRFQVSVNSADFDPILAVYTGSSLNALTLVNASDNTGLNNAVKSPLCTIDATAGATYMITVDTKTLGSVGQFTLSLVDSLWQQTTGSGVTGTPAVGSDGTVYVGSDDDSFYAFAPDGTQKWSYATGGSIDTCSPAIADDGTVYVGSGDGKLYAFTPTGTLKWTHNFAASTTLEAWNSPAIGVDGTIYIKIADGFLHALNPTDGSEKWKANVNALQPGFYGSPVIASDGTIYEGSDEIDNGFYAFKSDGTQKWRFATSSGVYGAPALDAAGNIYLASLTGTVYSLTPAGTLRWQYISGGNISSSMALSVDGSTVYYAGYDAKLYALNTATGTSRWTYPLGDQVRASSPAIDANGVIYIGCYDNKLYAVNPDGTLNRTYDMGGAIRSAPAIDGSRLYVGSSDQKLYAFALAAGPAAGPWPQYRQNVRHLGRNSNSPLAIATEPQSQTAVVGVPLTLSIVATGQGTLSYQWDKDGTPIAGATSASYTVASPTTATAGSYTAIVSGTQGTITSSPAVVTVSTQNVGRLVNVSVRTTAGSGSQTLIVGFVVTGSGSKQLLVRGVGPTLASYGVTDALAAPQLQVLVTQSSALVASNNGWDGSAATTATFNSVGAFPLPVGSKDDALVTNVTPNSYSAEVTGANNTVGTALVEVYDLDSRNAPAAARLTNISARAQVGTNGNILIAGFVISGNVPKQVLIRGIGPALLNYGVTGVLANPRVDIYDGNNQFVTGNDDWGGSPTLQTAFQSVGAFTLSTTSQDAALLITLPPGGYTAQVSGVNSTTGVGLVEVYEMP